MKNHILSVSQMCDQGHIPSFDSKKFEIRKKILGRMVATTLISPKNIYILDEIRGDKYCCMGQINQTWLWNRRMRHIHFDNLVKIGKKQVVRDMTPIIKPSYTICKNCQHGR
jgi:hypothetical protein